MLVNNKIIYTCPMHPEIELDHFGICPICGMDLELKQITENHSEEEEYRKMKLRLWIGTGLTIPIFFLSMFDHLFGNNFELISKWVQWFLCTPIIFLAGGIFFERAWYSLVNRSLNMFTLIALGIGTAYLYSTISILFPELFPPSFKEDGKIFVYFEASAVITVLVLLGQVLEIKAKSRTTESIKALIGIAAKTGHLINSQGEESEIPIDQIKVGDILRVKPGEKVPIDGELIEGTSWIDESMITGEPLPVMKIKKSAVTGGTINQTGSFLMVAKHVGKETLLARIIQMVQEAQRSKAPIQKLVDVVSAYFVPFVIVVAILTFIFWSMFGPEPRLVYALVNAVAVLIIACPCALGLATPMSIMVGVGKGARMGVLIKNAEALEILEKINMIVLDKTGTLTEGKPKILEIVLSSDWKEDELLQLTASLEKNSEHPLALALIEKAKERNLTLKQVDEFQSITGEGVFGLIDGKKVYVGSVKFLQVYEIIGLEYLQNLAKKSQEQAQTVIFVGIDGKSAGFLVIADPIKPSTPAAIKYLHQLGLKVMMLTGDNSSTAYSVTKKLQIDEVRANVSPTEKQRVIQEIKTKQLMVAMAGDGINDSAALAAADVGIAMGTGSDVAIESAGITLVKGDLLGIIKAITLSRMTMRNIRQNLFFAFIYNILGIPIAAGLLFPFFGLLLNPMIASAAMAFSSLSVILNALRINRDSTLNLKHL